MNKSFSDPHKIPARLQHAAQNTVATAGVSPLARVTSGAYTDQRCLASVVTGPAIQR